MRLIYPELSWHQRNDHFTVRHREPPLTFDGMEDLMPHLIDATSACKIIPFQMEVLARHREYLSRWVEASLPMGICDADVFSTTEKQSGSSSEYIVVWVRETSDPAYKVFSRGNKWIVMDAIRDNQLGQFASFADAMHMIRPVLPRPEKIVAA